MIHFNIDVSDTENRVTLSYPAICRSNYLNLPPNPLRIYISKTWKLYFGIAFMSSNVDWISDCAEVKMQSCVAIVLRKAKQKYLCILE